MFKETLDYQHDYPRLATDAGFCFDKRKSDGFDKNRLSLVDIDRIVEERDFATVEKFIPCIIQFVLDPEQVQLLDAAFVKTFCLSQLAIQFLLFCKKFLDNTVVALKRENTALQQKHQELEQSHEELKEYLLMKESSEKPLFKCEQCNKLFSTEEFLNSHIKRRHSVALPPEEQKQETDKLHLEIKELKGRLNSAEKMFQQEQPSQASPARELDSKKIDDLLLKFEELRLHVQSELKIIQGQHNLETKYEKLFEAFANQKLQQKEENVAGGGGRSNLGRRRESTTQTDLEVDAAKVVKQPLEEIEKENIPDLETAQKQIVEFGEAIQSKVTSSLEKIESQMQSFWKKLNDMEMQRVKYRDKKNYEESEKQSESKKLKPDYEEVKPMVKPRSKYNNTNSSHKTIKANRQTKPKVESEQIVPPRQSVKKIKVEVHSSSPDLITKDEDVAVSDSEATVSESFSNMKQLPPKTNETAIVAKKKLINRDVINDELLSYFRDDVEKIIMGRLQELGVSPNWKGLPNHSFQKALEIVNHQANLAKKNYPNFDVISKQLERAITEKVKTDAKPTSKPVKKHKTKATPARTVEIKNRNMYDTDSESEVKPPPGYVRKVSTPYSAVIEELKTVTQRIDSEPSDEGVKNEETKGVLKNYPSVGSLTTTKKKVLFNLENDEGRGDVLSKDGGSSTSVASSVLDGASTDKNKAKNRDIEDLSDFDFSDI